MNVHEPATLATDLMLSALGAWLAWRLRQRTSPDHSSARWWSRTLALTALSALVGGTYHGFAPNFPGAVQSLWWTLTLLLICLIGAAMAMSLLHEAVPRGRQRPWRTVILFKLLAFGGAAITHPQFAVAIMDYGLAMIAWAAAAVLLNRPWRGWMLAGIGLSVVAAAAQQLHWGFSARFNHNDVYHVIQAFALLAFYRAGARLAA